MAEGRNLSWDEIRSNYSKYVVEGPKVGFGGRVMSIMDTCYLADTDELRTTNKVQTYDRQDRGDRTIWVPMGKKYLKTARVYEVEVCGGRRDCDWYTETREYNLNPMMTVRAPARGDRSFGRVLFKKSYSVKSCN